MTAEDADQNADAYNNARGRTLSLTYMNVYEGPHPSYEFDVLAQSKQ